MKTVHILADKTRIVDYFLSPIIFNKKNLLKKGYKINVYHKPTEKCLSCDYLMLISKSVLNLVGENKVVINEPSPTLDLLKQARKYAGKIIWMDSSDSTSVTHFELMPYIDLYLKKQLLKDKNLYSKKFIGGRIFTDFYHRKFGLPDDTDFNQQYPLANKYFSKVDLSWNIGLGVMYKAFSLKNKIRIKFPYLFEPNYNVNFTKINRNRNIDVFIRTTFNLKNDLISFHRKELLICLQKIIDKYNLTGSTKGEWLTDQEYTQRVDSSKILPSPFGWGELGVRDYEAFIHGCALLKPDMDHMDTWPDIFKKNVTYIPFRWDFKDLDEKIIDLLQNKDKRLKIAKSGQLEYKASISNQGMSDFCDWFIQQINK